MDQRESSAAWMEASSDGCRLCVCSKGAPPFLWQPSVQPIGVSGLGVVVSTASPPQMGPSWGRVLRMHAPLPPGFTCLGVWMAVLQFCFCLWDLPLALLPLACSPADSPCVSTFFSFVWKDFFSCFSLSSWISCLPVEEQVSVTSYKGRHSPQWTDRQVGRWSAPLPSPRCPGCTSKERSKGSVGRKEPYL
jgi:hypothetical protein